MGLQQPVPIEKRKRAPICSWDSILPHRTRKGGVNERGRRSRKRREGWGLCKAAPTPGERGEWQEPKEFGARNPHLPWFQASASWEMELLGEGPPASPAPTTPME